jgi:hypothetical protein
MQRYDVDTKNGCSMYDSDLGAYVTHADADSELSALRARVAELEQDAKVLRARLATPPEWAPVLAALSDNPDTERDGLRTEVVRLTQRLATLEAPPVVPEGWTVKRSNDEDGPWVLMCASASSDWDKGQRSQALRALTWALEHDQRPPHASDEVEP